MREGRGEGEGEEGEGEGQGQAGSWGEDEVRGSSTREGYEDERGFEYTTTANIARHLRSDTRGGELHYFFVAQ